MPITTIPNYEPDQLTAGDTATWTRHFDLFSAADGWTLSYVLLQQKTGLRLLLTSSADGTDHLINISAAITAGWTDGTYRATGFCSKGADRFTVWQGAIRVLPNPAGADPADPRSTAQKILDNIEAVLYGRATQEILEFTIEGTTLRKSSVNDLLALRDRYAVIVQKEQAADAIRSGSRTGQRILTRFLSRG